MKDYKNNFDYSKSIEESFDELHTAIRIVKEDHELELRNGFGGERKVVEECRNWMRRIKMIKNSFYHKDIEKIEIWNKGYDFYLKMCEV